MGNGIATPPAQWQPMFGTGTHNGILDLKLLGWLMAGKKSGRGEDSQLPRPGRRYRTGVSGFGFWVRCLH